MRLSERLSRIEALLEVNNATTDKLVNMLDGENGVVVRLDRVERGYACLRKWTGMIGATAMAALVQKVIPVLGRLVN